MIALHNIAKSYPLPRGKFGFVDNTADIEYFTIDESGAYAPMQPTITINLPSK